MSHLVFQLYGTKPTRENVDNLLFATEEGSAAIEPAGPGIILDIFPPARYLPNKQFKKLIEVRGMNDQWFNKEIKDRKVRDLHCMVVSKK